MSGTLLARVQPIHRGTHDSTKAYETLDIVVNADGTAAYMAAQSVPAGTELTNADYWEMMVDVSAAVANANAAADSGVRTDAAQNLTETQQAQARANINAPLPIVATAEGETIAVSDASDMPLQGLRIFGKTTQAAEPTPDAPQELVSVGNGGIIEINVGGKNLLNVTATSQMQHGVTVTVNPDKSIRFAGTAEQATVIYIADKAQMLPQGRYVVNTTNPTPAYEVCTTILEAYDTGGKWLGNLTTLTNGSIEKEFEINDANEGFLSIYLRVQQGATIDYKMDLMIRSASIGDKSYEQHKQIQNISIATPNDLPGIPVASGGNYTDADGQQWICDEVDLVRGKHVQRVKALLFNGDVKPGLSSGQKYFFVDIADRSYGSPIMCDKLPHASGLAGTTPAWWADNPENSIVAFTGFVDSGIATTPDEMAAYMAANPITIHYILATPIETALSAEEIAAYKALYSNYPNTTVYNDAGAHMAVSYAADTKLYIDNKLAELSTAIANNI